MLDVTDHPGLTFATIDARQREGEAGARLLAWGEALSRGFHEGRLDDDRRDVWLRHTVADDVVLRGVWPEKTGIAPATMPVATYSSWSKSINVGGGRQLPLHMISDVTVAPTHRRQGLLRALITDDLADAVRRELPLAALTVSEGTIYGRFGFGVATRGRIVEVDVTSRFALHTAPDSGWLEMVEPDLAWPTVERVFAAHQASVRGSVDRPDFYASLYSGAFDWEKGGPDRMLRAVVHLDGTGQPDGYALFKHAGHGDDPPTVDLVDLVALTPEADLQLWRFLADVDLVARVRWRRAPDSTLPLEWAVTDPRVVSTTAVRDTLWLRLLDVPVALAARPWGADGSVVLGVDDPLGHAAGSWRVTTRDGAAEVAVTDDEPAVLMGVEVLGSLYLGGVTVATLQAAGRLSGDDGALATWAAMADTGPTPYNTTGF